MTFEEKTKYIREYIKSIAKKDCFVQFSNTDEFQELSLETKEVLKNPGLVSYELGRLITDGKLKKIDEDKIQIGKAPHIDTVYFIDTSKGDAVFGLNKYENEIYPVNSSIKKYLECEFVMNYFSEEIEGEESLGPYWENDNFKNYAQKLKEMFLEVEENIMELSWASQVIERELGVL